MPRGRRSQGDPEEGDFVARVAKGSITKMIECAIGGDGNCVNGVIITNLEAISSRPDQSEDAPPFPEPGPFHPFHVSDPTLGNGNRIFEQLVFKSREPFAAPSTSTSTSPSSPSPLHFRRRLFVRHS